MNKHTQIKNFIQSFLTDRNLFFHSIDMYPAFRSIVPEYGDFKLSSDIVGNDKKVYTFAFVGVEQFDLGTSENNETNMQMFDDFSGWITEKERNKEYPDFGDKCSKYQWEVLQNMASLAAYDPDTGTAKYMLSCRLKYTEKGE